MPVAITNTNKFVHRDGYNGIKYEFNPNEKVLVEDGAAKHMFGYGDPNKEPYLIRNGWLQNTSGTDGGPKDAESKLMRFKFDKVEIQYVEVGEDGLKIDVKK